MEIKDRIRMIMEREKVPPKVFAKTIGVQQSTLSHILNGRNKPSLDVIMKVHQKYDYVNLEWLLYGEGEMMSRMMAMPITPAIKKNDIFSASAIFNSLCEKAVCACSSRSFISLFNVLFNSLLRIRRLSA